MPKGSWGGGGGETLNKGPDSEVGVTDFQNGRQHILWNDKFKVGMAKIKILKMCDTTLTLGISRSWYLSDTYFYHKARHRSDRVIHTLKAAVD